MCFRISRLILAIDLLMPTHVCRRRLVSFYFNMMFAFENGNLTYKLVAKVCNKVPYKNGPYSIV